MSFEKSMTVKIIKGLFWILLVLTPLVHGSFATESFEFPKMFLIYFVGSLIIVAFALGLVWNQLKFKKPPFVVVLFFLTQVVSTAFSRFPYTSLWGYYPRLNGGLISALIYFGLFVVAYSVFDYKTILKTFFFSLILTVIPVSIIGIFQHFGWIGGVSIERVYSTIGQPNWLAIYLVWAGLLVLHRFLKDSFDNSTFIWFGVFALIVSCLWFTYSLSGFLSFFVATLLLLILNKSRYFFKRIPFLILPFCLLAIFSPGMLFLRLQDGLIDFVNLLSARLTVYAQSRSYQISDPGFIRLGLWKGTLFMCISSVKNFLVGTGPGTFAYIFPFFRPLSLNYSSEWDFILNKPHNYYLELFAETGIFSVIFYAWILLKALLKKHPWSTGIFTAFAISNFFGWPSTVINLHFWILLAGIFQYEK